MSRDYRKPQRAFTGGERSPNTQARADLDNWTLGAATMENFVPFIQGGMTRRSGTRDVDSGIANSVMIPFAFSASDGYAIDFREGGSARLYRDNGYLQNGDGSPYTIAHTFDAAELRALRYAQNADAMFLACGTKAVQLLQRPTPAAFTLDFAALKKGPFMPTNKNEANFLWTDDAGELVAGRAFTLKSTSDTFLPGHVDALWLITEMDRSNAWKWKNGASFALNTIGSWDGNTYKNTQQDGPKTGDNPPVHTVGADWDGSIGDTSVSKGYLWLYLHSGWGVLKITGYTGPREVSAIAMTYIPNSLQNFSGAFPATKGTNLWAEGAFSDVRGYPSLLGFHKKRLYAASTSGQPTTLFASVIDDYTNFDAQPVSGDILDDKAFTVELAADTGRVNIPVWMVSGAGLAIGTAGDEFVIQSAESGSPITPATVEAQSATTEGSANLSAVKIDGPIFVSKDGRRLHELLYDFSTNSYAAPELTDLADHIAGPGIVKIAWQREPYRLLWALRSDGVLAAMSYRRDENVRGWHRHPFVKGNVLDICPVPAPSGTRQDLWLKVQRPLAGGTVIRIEMLQPFFERGSLDVKDAWFVDCGYEILPPEGHDNFTSFTMPEFFAGETVDVLADGRVYSARIVANDGTVTLPQAATKAVCGLPMQSLYRSLRLDVDGAAGQLAGKNARISAVIPDVLRASGVEVAAGDQPFERAMANLPSQMAGGNDLYTGPLQGPPLPASWNDDGSYSLRCTTPLPCTVRALTPLTQVAR